MMIWKRAKALAELGILGMNRRNADFIAMVNARKNYPLVDNKLTTKKLAQKSGVAVPKLYEVIEFQAQIKSIHERLEQYPEFVVKPACGGGGEGIIVITGRTRDKYRKSSGLLITKEELNHHLSMILGGVYSLGGHPDNALIEYKVKFDPVFEHISYLGVPDIRIIIYMGVPVMAMIRLPTRASDGKANLHQGALGAGIDISTGKTVSAVWYNSVIQQHPDTGHEVLGVTIPHWDKLLEIASSAYEMTGLGYIGVDIVLDRELGPLLLELNARPGLNIQIANKAGLLPRLELINKCRQDLKSLSQRIEFGKTNFAISNLNNLVR